MKLKDARYLADVSLDILRDYQFRMGSVILQSITLQTKRVVKQISNLHLWGIKGTSFFTYSTNDLSDESKLHAQIRAAIESSSILPRNHQTRRGPVQDLGIFLRHRFRKLQRALEAEKQREQELIKKFNEAARSAIDVGDPFVLSSFRQASESKKVKEMDMEEIAKKMGVPLSYLQHSPTELTKLARHMVKIKKELTISHAFEQIHETSSLNQEPPSSSPSSSSSSSSSLTPLPPEFTECIVARIEIKEVFKHTFAPGLSRELTISGPLCYSTQGGLFVGFYSIPPGFEEIVPLVHSRSHQEVTHGLLFPMAWSKLFAALASQGSYYPREMHWKLPISTKEGKEGKENEDDYVLPWLPPTQWNTPIPSLISFNPLIQAQFSASSSATLSLPTSLSFPPIIHQFHTTTLSEFLPLHAEIQFLHSLHEQEEGEQNDPGNGSATSSPLRHRKEQHKFISLSMAQRFRPLPILDIDPTSVATVAQELTEYLWDTESSPSGSSSRSSSHSQSSQLASSSFSPKMGKRYLLVKALVLPARHTHPFWTSLRFAFPFAPSFPLVWVKNEIEQVSLISFPFPLYLKGPALLVDELVFLSLPSQD